MQESNPWPSAEMVLGGADVERTGTALRELVPQAVALSVRALGAREPLHALEEHHVLTQRMHPIREREFRAGRTCARQALDEIGYHDAPVLPGAAREPLWPSGVIGSITHTRHIAAAAVARSAALSALGIDMEALTAVDESLAGTVLTAAERDRRPVGIAPGVWLLLHFSAKESAFKASFPHTHVFIEFQDIEVRFGTASKTFCVGSLPREPSLGCLGDLEGRWAISDTHVLTAAFAAA